MKKLLLTFFTILMVVCFAQTSSASAVALYDWAFNIDGTVSEDYYSDPWPVGVTTLDSQGLGTATWSTSTVGDHNFIAYFDHQWALPYPDDVYWDEYGAAHNLSKIGIDQSWEIDEPGYTLGDLYANMLAGSLDNSNNVDFNNPEDVSWAMGWDFNLGVGESALITLILTEFIDDIDTSAFYMSHTDPVFGETIYFQSTNVISDNNNNPVPEPSTIILFGIGILGLAGVSRKKQKNS
jgi:hypothetical protein